MFCRAHIPAEAPSAVLTTARSGVILITHVYTMYTTQLSRRQALPNCFEDPAMTFIVILITEKVNENVYR